MLMTHCQVKIVCLEVSCIISVSFMCIPLHGKMSERKYDKIYIVVIAEWWDSGWFYFLFYLSVLSKFSTNAFIIM